jgi:hypothetical protein
MSHGVKLTLFVLAFNVIGFAEGYLLRDFGLVWLIPILIVTALGAVLASRAVVEVNEWLTLEMPAYFLAYGASIISRKKDSRPSRVTLASLRYSSSRVSDSASSFVHCILRRASCSDEALPQCVSAPARA